MRTLAIIMVMATALLATSAWWLSTKPKEAMITIAFAGDTMLGRMVSKTLMQLPLDQRCSYLWGDILEVMQAADLRIINLETTFTTSTTAVPKVFNFEADPALAPCLNTAHIDIVNLANNHSLDFGVQGLRDTIATLDQVAIHHVGAGMNITAARAPVIIEKNDLRIGVLGWTDNEPTWLAEDAKAGINYVQVGNVAWLAHITALKKIVDVVIVSMHWGPNMRTHPPQEFQQYAHAMIDAGADVIHGHSAHIFQGIELYKNKLIMYDTGDFVDDYAIDEQLRNDLSFIFLVSIGHHGPQKVELVPTKISMMQVNKATGADKQWALERMQQLCAQWNTPLKDSTISLST